MAPLVVAAAGVALILSNVLGPAPSNSAPADTMGVGSLAAATPTVSGGDTSSVPLGDPRSGWWWRLAPTFPDPDFLEAFRLDAGGFSGGPTHTVEAKIGLRGEGMRGALPFAAGPVDGLVAHGHWDGRTGRLGLLSAATGDDRLLAETDDIIHAAAFGSDDDLYFLTLTPGTLAESGIFRVSLAGGPPRLVAVTSEARSVQVYKQLVVAPDGSAVAVVDCSEGTCWIRGYDVTSGRQRWTAATAGGSVVGADAAGLMLARQCEEPCAITKLDWLTGPGTAVGKTCVAAVAVPTQAGTALVTDVAPSGRCRSADYEVVAYVPVPGGFVSPVAGFPTRERTLVARDGQIGFELPPGWVVVGPRGAPFPKEGVSPWFVDIDSRRVIRNE